MTNLTASPPGPGRRRCPSPFLAAGARLVGIASADAAARQRLLYVAVDGDVSEVDDEPGKPEPVAGGRIDVYDIADSHRLVRPIPVPDPGEVKGLAVHAATNRL